MENVIEDKNIKEFDINVRKRSTWKFLLFTVISIGYYQYFWLWKLINDLNDTNVLDKKLNYWTLALAWIILEAIDILSNFITTGIFDAKGAIFSSWDKFYLKIYALVCVCVAYIIIKKIEEYALKTYNVKIKHNPFGIYFLSLLYANFALNSFHDRVKKTIEKQKTDNN